MLLVPSPDPLGTSTDVERRIPPPALSQKPSSVSKPSRIPDAARHALCRAKGSRGSPHLRTSPMSAKRADADWSELSSTTSHPSKRSASAWTGSAPFRSSAASSMVPPCSRQ